MDKILLCEILIVMFFGIIGLVLGSFYACIGYRIPNKISLTGSRSFCPKCKKQIKWYMNIPVFSYIFLKGKCHYCKEKISVVYPIIETLSCLLSILGYLKYGFTLDYLIFYTLCSAFLVTCVSDFRYYYVSDRVVGISAIIIFFAELIKYGFKGTMIYVLHAILVFILMLLIKFLGDRAFGKESLGGGDIKIMSLVGLTIGFVPSLFTIFFASSLALPFAIFEMVKKKDEIVAFGPFLILGAMIIMYFYEPLLHLFNIVFSTNI